MYDTMSAALFAASYKGLLMEKWEQFWKKMGDEKGKQAKNQAKVGETCIFFHYTV